MITWTSRHRFTKFSLTFQLTLSSIVSLTSPITIQESNSVLFSHKNDAIYSARTEKLCVLFLDCYLLKKTKCNILQLKSESGPGNVFCQLFFLNQVLLLFIMNRSILFNLIMDIAKELVRIYFLFFCHIKYGNEIIRSHFHRVKKTL